MEKMRYESPEFRFRDLFLFEGVATTCWGFHEANLAVYFDRDHDGSYDTGETIIYSREHIAPPPKEGHSVDPNPSCASVKIEFENQLSSIQTEFLSTEYASLWQSVSAKIDTKTSVHGTATLYIPIHS